MIRPSPFFRIAAFVCAAAPILAVGVSAQEVLTLPEGLPEWTFNIPPKEQPWAVKVEGMVKAKGSAREYDAKKIAGNANPPDWFPEEHPAAPARTGPVWSPQHLALLRDIRDDLAKLRAGVNVRM